MLYVSRTRSGFTPSLRAELLRRMKTLEVTEYPFVNLPEPRPRRWGEGLTADKMKDCRWLAPTLVARFEFLDGPQTVISGTAASLRSFKVIPLKGQDPTAQRPRTGCGKTIRQSAFCSICSTNVKIYSGRSLRGRLQNLWPNRTYVYTWRGRSRTAIRNNGPNGERA